MKKHLVQPCFDRVLVLRKAIETETAGGLVVPDHSQEKPQEGMIVAVGPSVKTTRMVELEKIAFAPRKADDEDAEKRIAAQNELDEFEAQVFNLGDHVVFGKYSGIEYEIDGIVYVQLKQDEILSKVVEFEVPDPEQIAGSAEAEVKDECR